jgi:hypothetical protein
VIGVGDTQPDIKPLIACGDCKQEMRLFGTEPESLRATFSPSTALVVVGLKFGVLA